MMFIVDFTELGFQVSPFLVGGDNVPREVFLVVLHSGLAGAKAGTPISVGTAYFLTLNQADAPLRVSLFLLLQAIVGCCHTHAAGSNDHQVVHLSLH